ncbi:Ankyrin repeat domain-containing protein 27 [Folsomia candida]|uniref:Ankyrin repeat domain-containing protein 27 n=1 Tax=Folsomia candida TaxID=158441 RepID=A0A226DJ40_FOLCA|nr:Ankyrin repeat domain-containing protein 27 [Folsomia candida]
MVRSTILEDDVKPKTEAHSLQGNWNYQTLTHIRVELTGQTLILDVEIPISNDANDDVLNGNSRAFVQLRKEILFDETFYTNDQRKYKVLCVASPLNSKVDIEDAGFGNAGLGLWNLTSLRDCIDFMWVKGSFKILESYDTYIKLFLDNHPALENLPLPIQSNLVNMLFLQCVEFAEGTGMTTPVPENHGLSDFLRQKLRIATETYINHGVYRSIISAITSVTAAEDAFINKITRNLGEIHPQDLDIDPAFWNILGRARYELSRISSYSTPLGKLVCMKRTVRHIRANSGAESGDSSKILTTDELIPIWVYLVLKNPLGNWVAQLETTFSVALAQMQQVLGAAGSPQCADSVEKNRAFSRTCGAQNLLNFSHLQFLRNFRFSSTEEPTNEDTFYITTLEASLEYLKSGKVLRTSEENDPGSPCESWLYNLHHDAYESDNPQISEMFEAIRFGKCGRLEELIEEYEVQRFEFNKNRKDFPEIEADSLCHPLCQCVTCDAVFQSAVKWEPMIPAVQLISPNGLTLLHIACIYGRPKVVDILIGAGSKLEAEDSQGNRAIHYAASRGHQNAVLLLLHAGCDLNPTNKDLDTPLHLAAQNGHEGCVKALIYYAEHAGKNLNLSSGNKNLDSPLHFASRYGFLSIVNILTEHSASITCTNIVHATPIDCAHDIHILRILQRSLRRRSLVQTDHGDYVNIEMMQKEDSGGIVMLISEPADDPPTDPAPPPTESDGNRLKSYNNSRSVRRISNRRASAATAPPTLFMQNSQRSRRVSAMELQPEFNDARISTEKCLQTVVQHLENDPSNADFVVDYGNNNYDATTEQEHLRLVPAEDLGIHELAEEIEDKRERNIAKLFATIAAGDVPLALFYLGIPAEESDILQENDHCIDVIPPCHPLCPCPRCLAKQAGLRLSLDIQNAAGLSPLHLAVTCHLIVLVKALIKYGANVNLQSTVEKKTALDFAIARGYHQIEDVLLTAGGSSSLHFHSV